MGYVPRVNRKGPAPSRADFEPLAHKGLFLGVSDRNRGKYFVLRGAAMVPLVSPVNSQGMFDELSGAGEGEISDDVGEDMRSALYSCLRRCFRRDLERQRVAGITLDDVVTMYRKQKGVCSLTGMPFVLPRDRVTGERRGPWSPSIDRIDSKKGYSPGNVHLVTVMANVAKAEFSIKEFHHMCANATINLRLLMPRT